MTNKTYKQQVEKALQVAGASASLAASLITVHGDFINSAQERGRPADRVAQIMYETHLKKTRVC
jgi:hypothetical protein